MVLSIRDKADAETARRAARAFALELGFPPRTAEEIVLAVSELATNLAKYAQNGRLILSHVEGPSGPGMQIESGDDGPGIADIERAMEDRFSTGGSLGSGLPGVKRLTDDFEIVSDETGTRIRSLVWVKTSR